MGNRGALQPAQGVSVVDFVLHRSSVLLLTVPQSILAFSLYRPPPPIRLARSIRESVLTGQPAPSLPHVNLVRLRDKFVISPGILHKFANFPEGIDTIAF